MSGTGPDRVLLLTGTKLVWQNSYAANQDRSGWTGSGIVLIMIMIRITGTINIQQTNEEFLLRIRSNIMKGRSRMATLVNPSLV